MSPATVQPAVNEHITAADTNLAALEAVIERGIQTFVEVGAALQEIADGKLYREQGFKNFEDYCLDRWGWSRRHAYRQMEAAAVAQNLRPIGHIPANEAQARELVGLTPQEQVQVAESVDFSQATAKEVNKKVVAITGKTPGTKALKDEASEPPALSRTYVAKAHTEKGFKKHLLQLIKANNCSHLPIESIDVVYNASGKPIDVVITRIKRTVAAQ